MSNTVNGWTEIFTNADNSYCTVTSCLLMDSTCTTSITRDTSRFYINTSSPYNLKFKRNVAAGYGPISFCYKCLGTAASGFSKTALINYSFRQIRNCAT